MSISYEGIGQWAATFEAAAGVAAGKVVKVSANGKVAACAAGEDFCGVALSLSRGGDACAVQLGGMAVVSYSGTMPGVGFKTLAADGSGGVKTVTTGGRSFLVASVDLSTRTVSIVL
jgi:hypothetical protein